MKRLFFLIIICLLFSCGNQNKSSSNINPDKTFSFSMSWKDHIIKDSIYEFVINGDADSLKNIVISQNGGTLTKISDGRYQLEVTREIDSVKIVIMKRVAVMNQDVESGSFKMKPVKVMVVPVKKSSN